jgi:predicted PurR-regulated permease PerM/methylmalonyl-CoA mutase cobalamin-binding subunit
VLTNQLIDLATKLPEYKENIVLKMKAFTTTAKGGRFTKFSETLEELKKELPGVAQPEAPTITQIPGRPETAVSSPPAMPQTTMPVQVVETSAASPLEIAQTIIAPLLGPLGTAALVLLLVICMLFQREDLRNRLIRLIGQGRISTTTRAMDDAGRRVSRYLLMQFIVNLTYGVCVAIGLYFIGVPNAVLWGAFGLVLRFIPYIGPWVALVFPTILSLAVSPHWTMPVLTVSLFAGLELVLNNVMEPLLYGKHTGISAIALIVAAVFWTWLWGAVGLVLATPLTVCLVVMGRHVPRLSFLSVLLSDDDALTPAEDFYHRLLTPGERDEMEFVDSYLKTNPLLSLYDGVFIPVISTAELDAELSSLNSDQLVQVEQNLRDIVDDLGTRPVQPRAGKEPASEETSAVPLGARVYCLPARAQRDEVAGAMLAQLLQQNGSEAWVAPAKLVTGELLSLVETADVDVVCISVIAPTTVIQARYLCTKLRAQFPSLKILVGMWGVTEGVPEIAKRLRDSGADEVVTSMAEALSQITKLAPIFTQPMVPALPPAGEEDRLAALAELGLLDTDPEPVLDRITSKLTRIFDVPIALITLVDRDRQFFKSQIGLPEELATARQAPRETSVCGHVIVQNEILVVEDLARDRRFANNPFLKQHHLRFYAGAPLRAPRGQAIGSLCLLDTKPRQFTDRDQRQLQEYANEVMEEFARRAAAKKEPAALEAV